MSFRLHVRGVVVQNIVDEVRLVLVGADDSRIARHVVEDHGVGADAFLQREVFAGMPRIDGVDLRFDALAVTAGMQRLLNIVETERWQGWFYLYEAGPGVLECGRSRGAVRSVSNMITFYGSLYGPNQETCG